MNLNRVKQAVEIDAEGNLVFGAAEPGYRAVAIPPGGGSFSYLMSNADGSLLEVGTYRKGWIGGTWGETRYVDYTNAAQPAVTGGLPYGTTGLTLTVIGADVNVAATTSGSPGPTASGAGALALGAGADAGADYTTALGVNAKAYVPGEFAMGSVNYSRRSYVSGFVYVPSQGRDVLQSPGSTAVSGFSEQIQNLLPDFGVIRITGHVMVTNADVKSASDTQVYSVSVLKHRLGNGTLEAWYNETVPVFTPLIGPTDTTMDNVTLSFESGALLIDNDSTTRNIIVSALLVADYLSAQDWW